MSEQHREHSRPDPGEDEAVPAVAAPRVDATDEGLDDLLDEIDGVLERDAEEFVRSFVQKGGQ